MPSSRTPEGEPNRCPVCRQEVRIDPSHGPTQDAPCPHCGSLMWFTNRVAERAVIPLAALHEERVDVLDLPGRDELFIDACGAVNVPSALLGRLITLHHKAQRGGKRIVLVNVPPHVREVLAAVKLDRVLEIRPDEP